MKFCPVVPAICRGQVHGPRKERKIRIRIIIIKIIIRNGAKTRSLQTLFGRLNESYRWCDGYLARIESGRSWVQATVGSNQIIKLVFLASPLSTYHSLSPR
jgi:hypothetical protein